MGALAEFERDLIRERTKAGMKAAIYPVVAYGFYSLGSGK